MDKITLYSTGCPMCKMIEGKLKDKGILFEINSDIEEMQKKGITNVPVAEINGVLMKTKEILNWMETVKND